MPKYRIRTEDDIRKLPAYKFDVVPEDDPIEEIEDDYLITVATQCGLKGCHTWHNEGVIALTRSGARTNMGHICGARFRNFAEKYDDYKREKLTPRYQAQVVAFKRRGDVAVAALHQVLARIKALTGRAKRFREVLPTLARVVEQRANRGETKIERVFERTGREIEDLIASSPGMTRERARYGTQTTGHLNGLRAFGISGIAAPDMLDLERTLALDVVNSGFDKLARAARYCETFDDGLAAAQAAVADAETFFSTGNWTLLQHLATNSAEKDALTSRSPGQLLKVEKPKTPGQPTRKADATPRPETRFDKTVRAAIKSIYGTSRD
jgi:hypothetical protein